MKTEMDAMGMDERQREAWLRANRATLILVGLVWLGMIGWELAQGRKPVFLAVTVPVIAGFRWAVYQALMR